ncbi:MAG: glycosyltransferase family A protein [Patescibacteria group bacterium]
MPKKTNPPMSPPLISVVIASFNSRRTIEKCLLSIKKQTYPNLEIIVVDGLNYNPLEQKQCKAIIGKYATYYQDGPERSIQRNKGINEAKGEFILVIDQDMYLTENVIKDCYAMILSGNYIALTIPEVSIGVGYWTQCVAFERHITTFLEEGMNECCRFFRKKDALAINGFDPAIVGVEDSDFHYRMKMKGKIGKIKEFIYHDEGKTSFFGRIKKKYYYSKAFRMYLRRYPDIAAAQFFPIKKAYIKHFGLLLKHPFLTAGFILLRTGEVLAGFFGIIFKI